MFTRSCFIKKDTTELRSELEKLGYVHKGKSENKSLSGLYCCPNGYYECDKEPSRYESIIDCGKDERLFLAIAALRDDQSYMQWFTDGNDYILCDRQDWIDMYSTLCSGGKYTMEELDKFHKATAQELIQHFKDR